MRFVRRRPTTPFLKWVGGKGKLVKKLIPLLPRSFRSLEYVEPFVGGGAMFFALCPRRALLCDGNADVIDAYGAVQSQLPSLVRELAILSYQHRKDPFSTYYRVREAFNIQSLSTVERAARFIYLNKTCFNGLARYNQGGAFNVPIGRYTDPKILDHQALEAASEHLKHARLGPQSFEVTLVEEAKKGVFMYLDPPYDPVSKTSNFTAFTPKGFNHIDQSKVFNAYRRADSSGALLMLSNSDTPMVRRLYSGYNVTEIQAPRSINSKADARGPVAELVITNYEV